MKTIKDTIDSLIPINVKDKDYVKLNKIETRKMAIAGIEAICREAIGEVEELSKPIEEGYETGKKYRNKLRTDQLARLKQLIGE